MLQRTAPPILALFLLALGACGGGGSSPTELSAPVPLEGNWAGTITITSPAPTSTCSVRLNFFPDSQAPAPGFFIGSWHANCSGKEGGNVASLNPALGTLFLIGLGTPDVFGCGWSSPLTRGGRRLTGNWSTADNCALVQRGRIDLEKQD